MGKVYSREYKEQVCKRIIEGGEKASQVSLELDLHENTVYNWVRTYKERNGNRWLVNG